MSMFIVIDKVDELERQVRELELQLRVERLERALKEALRHTKTLVGRDNDEVAINELIKLMQYTLKED